MHASSHSAHADFLQGLWSTKPSIKSVKSANSCSTLSIANGQAVCGCHHIECTHNHVKINLIDWSPLNSRCSNFPFHVTQPQVVKPKLWQKLDAGPKAMAYSAPPKSINDGVLLVLWLITCLLLNDVWAQVQCQPKVVSSQLFQLSILSHRLVDK